MVRCMFRKLPWSYHSRHSWRIRSASASQRSPIRRAFLSYSRSNLRDCRGADNCIVGRSTAHVSESIQHTYHTVPSARPDLPARFDPAILGRSCVPTTLSGTPSGFRLPGNTAVWVKSLTGDGPLKVRVRDICLVERIEQHVPDRILQPPCFLRRDNVALLVLPYPFKSGELRLELRHIPSQFLLHFVGSELSAGILGRMGTCSLTI